MSEQRLEHLTRSLVQALDRRTGVRRLLALGGTALGLTAAIDADDAEAGRSCKPACTECQQCKKGKCHKTKSGKKKCKKCKCKPKVNGTVCTTGTCQGGVCQSGPPSCTGLQPTGTGPTQGLQQAIDAAKAGATLTLCAGTWSLSSTVIIDKDLTVRGTGAAQTILDGGDAVQVLQIMPETTVVLQDLMIMKGKADYGGGILNAAMLTLSGVSVTRNAATENGGGIWNKVGTLILQTGSSVTENTGNNGGGIASLFSAATVTLRTGSSVTNNTATNDGGGIWLSDGTLIMETGTSVTNNTSANDGGGIYNDEGTLTLQTGSSVTNNTATSYGGGIFIAGEVTLEGGNPSPIVVNNCPTNCGGPGSPSGVDNCAETPVSC